MLVNSSCAARKMPPFARFEYKNTLKIIFLDLFLSLLSGASALALVTKHFYLNKKHHFTFGRVLSYIFSLPAEWEFEKGKWWRKNKALNNRFSPDLVALQNCVSRFQQKKLRCKEVLYGCRCKLLYFLNCLLCCFTALLTPRLVFSTVNRITYLTLKFKSFLKKVNAYKQ